MIDPKQTSSDGFRISKSSFIWRNTFFSPHFIVIVWLREMKTGFLGNSAGGRRVLFIQAFQISLFFHKSIRLCCSMTTCTRMLEKNLLKWDLGFQFRENVWTAEIRVISEDRNVTWIEAFLLKGSRVSYIYLFIFIQLLYCFKHKGFGSYNDWKCQRNINP